MVDLQIGRELPDHGLAFLRGFFCLRLLFSPAFGLLAVHFGFFEIIKNKVLSLILKLREKNSFKKIFKMIHSIFQA